jgi:phenylacetate-CoA ligase
VQAWLLRAVVAPAWARHEASPYLRVAAGLARGERRSRDEREAEQWNRVRAVVAHAYGKTGYYRRAFADCGFEPGDLRTWDDFRRLPALTKRQIRGHREAMLALPRESLIPRKTSGSSGVSLDFFVDEPCRQMKRAVALYRDRWTGWDLGEIRAMVWGNPPENRTLRQRLRSRLLDRAFYLDTLHMDEGTLAAFADRVLEEGPTLLFGHAHSLLLFARFWRDHGYAAYRFKGIISTAMVLHDHERAGIEEVFGRIVFDRYGCEEVSLIASECRAHTGLHVNTDALVVEVVEDGQAWGGGGKVIVTDLHNRGMPFIRYEVGDRAVASDRACSCGRTYPLLDAVAGRIADYLITPDGSLVSGISLTENFATLIPGVEQVQLVQEERDHLTVRIVPAPEFGDVSRAAIQSMVRERFGAAMRHTVEEVERIPQEPSGKYRFSICRIPEAGGNGPASG